MQNRYLDYSINDFVWDEDFREWVLSPTETTNAFWNAWISSHPESREDIEAAREIILSLNVQSPTLNHEDYASFLDNTVYKATGKKGNSFINIRRLFIAASVLIFCILGYFYFGYKDQNKSADNKARSVYYKNEKKSSSPVKLIDGSEIVLDAGSSMRVDPAFNTSERKVFLHGNAFFSVARDTSKPFYVYCENMEVRVLGTSFKIQSDSLSKNIRVTVQSGVVSVSMPEKVKGKEIGKTTLIVTRNQQADYQSNTGSLVKSIAANPLESDENFSNFVYEATPVYAIFSDFEKAYNIEVIYDKHIIANDEFSGNLQGKTLQEKIKVICYALGYNYKTEDAKIIVY